MTDAAVSPEIFVAFVTSLHTDGLMYGCSSTLGKNRKTGAGLHVVRLKHIGHTAQTNAVNKCRELYALKAQFNLKLSPS